MDNDVKESKVVQLRIDDIIPNRFQPREVFDETALKELASSIQEHGVIQPIIVRPLGDKYELIAGERRTKASSLAGLTTIPAIIRNMDDNESAKISLLENLQRRNLSAIEEARTYKKILELDNMTQEQLAKNLGKSQPMVANKLRLLALPEEIQDALIKNQISERHARSLLGVKPKEKQLMLLDRIRNERLTVRELDSEIKKMTAEDDSNKLETEGKEDTNMNNNFINGNMYNDFNSNNSNNNYHSNFGNMGLNDYQSSINNGMFNNLPNMSNQAMTPNNNNFQQNFNNNPFPDNTNFSNNQASVSTLGSMFDGNNASNNNQMLNSFNNNDNNEKPTSNDSNRFISQIKETADSNRPNQFLPNFDDTKQGDFFNQNNFGMLDNNDNVSNNFESYESNHNNNINNNPGPIDFNNGGIPNNFNDNNSNNNSNFDIANDFSFNGAPNNTNQPMNSNMPTDFPFAMARPGSLFDEPLNIVDVQNSKVNDNNNTDESDKDKQTTPSDTAPLFPPFEDKKEHEEEEAPKAQEDQEEQENPEAKPEESSTSDDAKPDQSSAPSKKEYIQLDAVQTIFDTRGAVLELKKTTDRIKENKIKIDTEEIEFDDYYQITIKIKK